MSASTTGTSRFETRGIHSGQESLCWEGATYGIFQIRSRHRLERL
jgi:hypothetical protein